MRTGDRFYAVEQWRPRTGRWVRARVVLADSAGNAKFQSGLRRNIRHGLRAYPVVLRFSQQEMFK